MSRWISLDLRVEPFDGHDAPRTPDGHWANPAPLRGGVLVHDGPADVVVGASLEVEPGQTRGPAKNITTVPEPSDDSFGNQGAKDLRVGVFEHALYRVLSVP